MDNNLYLVVLEGKERLKEAGIPGRMDAEFIMRHVLQSDLPVDHNTTISPDKEREFWELIELRVNRHSMDSILGYTEFMGLDIHFSKDTLSPRQETEIMVDAIVSDFRDKHNLHVLDLCSGSGCIGLAIARHLHGSSVILADISEKALEESRHNAAINNVEVQFVKSDLFDNVSDTFDIIISNPPYIPSGDITNLEREVVDFDPVLALDGGEDGLDIYRRLAPEVPSHLRDGGYIFIEFGIGQTKDLISIFEPYVDDIQIVKDYGGVDRYLKARKKVYVE